MDANRFVSQLGRCAPDIDALIELGFSKEEAIEFRNKHLIKKRKASSKGEVSLIGVDALFEDYDGEQRHIPP